MTVKQNSARIAALDVKLDAIMALLQGGKEEKTVEKPVEKQPKNHKACACYTAGGGKCSRPASKKRVIAGSERDVCGTHARKEIAAFVTAKGAKNHADKAAAKWAGIVADRAARKAQRKADPQVKTAPWLTVENLIDRVGELGSGEHKVMGIGASAWVTWLKAHGEDFVADESGEFGMVTLAGVRAAWVSESGKQGKTDEVLRGVAIA